MNGQNNHNNNNNNQPQRPSNPMAGINLPHKDIIIGTLAIIFGLLLISRSYAMLKDLLFFSFGSACVYYGVSILRLDSFKHLFFSLKARVMQFFRK